MAGIVYQLRTGVPWRLLPTRQLGCGSPVTYVVERSLAWLVGHRRLQVRYERRADLLLGFLHLAGALIRRNSLEPVEGMNQATRRRLGPGGWG